MVVIQQLPGETRGMAIGRLSTALLLEHLDNKQKPRAMPRPTRTFADIRESIQTANLTEHDRRELAAKLLWEGHP